MLAIQRQRLIEKYRDKAVKVFMMVTLVMCSRHRHLATHSPQQEMCLHGNRSATAVGRVTPCAPSCSVATRRARSDAPYLPPLRHYPAQQQALRWLWGGFVG